MPEHHGQNWDDDDIETLIRMLKDGASRTSMAQALKRSNGSIVGYLCKLRGAGVIDKARRPSTPNTSSSGKK
jgi:predicted transcriptional regulator